MIVGDDAGLGVERVGAPVERLDALARPRTAHHEVARHLRRVEDVQGPPPVVGDVVGDVDQRRDRAQADGDQPALHPVRARPVRHARHAAQREAGAQLGRLDAHAGGACPFAPDRLDARVPERAQPRRGEIARDAVHARAVGPVGGEADLDDRIVQPRQRGVGRADGVLGEHARGQVDDALVRVGQLQLALGAHHAAALDAADLAHADRRVDARHVGPRQGERAHETGARVRRPAHHGQRLAAVHVRARVDRQHAQPVRVGVRRGLEHAGDAEGQQGRAVVHPLHLQPDAGQRVGDGGEVGVGVEVVAQPGEGELHDCPCVRRCQTGSLRNGSVASRRQSACRSRRAPPIDGIE